jgi:hypothetical protein
VDITEDRFDSLDAAFVLDLHGDHHFEPKGPELRGSRRVELLQGSGALRDGYDIESTSGNVRLPRHWTMRLRPRHKQNLTPKL